jgi:NADPH-dependent curcumin reductase CurA
MKNQSIILDSRPIGEPVAANFRLVESNIPDLVENQVLLQTVWLSLDPYMRGMIDAREGSTPGIEIGQVLKADTVAMVVQSTHAEYTAGDCVVAYAYWQKYSVSDGTGLRKIDPNTAPLSAFLGILGMPGVTAHVGLLQFGLPKQRETVVVAAASGPVGSLVGQIAKLKGCRVVGIAGSDEKCRFILEELEFDAAVNHHDTQLAQSLAKACPNGIDIYFENVGGHVWKAVLPLLNSYARVPVCGLVAHYNDVGPPAGPNLVPELMDTILVKRLSIRGFIVDDFHEQAEVCRSELLSWFQKGEIIYKEDVTEGLYQAPAKFIGMLTGTNFGKTLIKVS